MSVKRLLRWYKLDPIGYFIEIECKIIVKWIADKYGSKFVKDIADEVLDRTAKELSSGPER